MLHVCAGAELRPVVFAYGNVLPGIIFCCTDEDDAKEAPVPTPVVDGVPLPLFAADTTDAITAAPWAPPPFSDPKSSEPILSLGLLPPLPLPLNVFPPPLDPLVKVVEVLL